MRVISHFEPARIGATPGKRALPIGGNLRIGKRGIRTRPVRLRLDQQQRQVLFGEGFRAGVFVRLAVGIRRLFRAGLLHLVGTAHRFAEVGSIVIARLVAIGRRLGPNFREVRVLPIRRLSI